VILFIGAQVVSTRFRIRGVRFALLTPGDHHRVDDGERQSPKGERTASGEHFDMHALTAAHRTLPFGTIVRVTRLKTGKSVNVRI
jgi:hypothetical protein